MTDTLDALADGQFQPKLGDPGDTLTKRGGKGSVVFAGREYSRLAWITRSATLGHTLHAGEGQLLAERVRALEALAKAAFEEGQAGRILDRHEQFIYDVRWEDSEACKALGAEA